MIRIWSSTLAHCSWSESGGTVISNFLWKFFFFLLYSFRESSIRRFDLHTCRQIGPGTYKQAHCAYVWVKHYESMILIPHWHEPLKWFWSKLLSSVLDRTKDIWCRCAVLSYNIRTVQCWWHLLSTCSLDRSVKVIWRLQSVAVINALVFYSQNFCLFELMFFCFSLLAVISVSFHSLSFVGLFCARSHWSFAQYRHFLRSLSYAYVSGLYQT